MPERSLLCRLRGEAVAATAEELVRQTFINHMIDELGYPPALMAVEKQLKELPHLQDQPALPNRRIDLLCYRKDPIWPLLLVECKAEALTSQAREQVIGYNRHVQASFVALHNQQTTCCGWRDLEGWQWVETLPTYQELLSALSF